MLLGLAAAIFVFYRSGVRQAGQPPQAVGAPVTGMKAPPPVEAQPQDPAAGLQIYKSEGDQPFSPNQKGVHFAPSPEQPEARPQPGAPTVVVTPIAPAAPAAAAPTLRPSIPAQTLAPAVPRCEGRGRAAKARASEGRTAQTRTLRPSPRRPRRRPPSPPSRLRPSRRRRPLRRRPPPRASPPCRSGPSRRRALADKGWNDAAAIAPGAAAGKGKSVEKVEKDGHTLFRTQVTGFASPRRRHGLLRQAEGRREGLLRQVSRFPRNLGAMSVGAAILGCSGPTLTADERAFFRRVKPWGFILFGRNVETPDQVRVLVDALRDTVGRADAPVLIDQEGGRVQRLGPPHWGTLSAGAGPMASWRATTRCCGARSPGWGRG